MDDDSDFLLDEEDGLEDQPVNDGSVSKSKANFDARRKIEIYLEEKALEKLIGDHDFDMAI